MFDLLFNKRESYFVVLHALHVFSLASAILFVFMFYLEVGTIVASVCGIRLVSRIYPYDL